MGVVEKELGVLASERRRVEWLGRSLAMLKPDVVKLRQKQDAKQVTLEPERTSNPRSTSSIRKEIGCSGSKRHRSAISPVRESGKKMFRCDSGKKAVTVESSADNQLLPYPANQRDAGLGDMIQSKLLTLVGSNLPAHNIGSRTQKSRGLPKMQDTSITRRPSHKLVGVGSCKGFEKNYSEFTLMGGSKSDRPFGDQLAIKRKSLRPPGSIFKVATPVTWSPSYSISDKARKKYLSSASILERSGTRATAGKSTMKATNVNGPVRKEKRKVNKMASKGVSQEPQVERRSSHDAECSERYTHKTSDLNSDLCKWLLTPSSFELKNEKDSVWKPDISVSKATKPKASHPTTDEKTSEKQSWSERMKAFLLSCGALLTESNTSKQRTHRTQPSFTDGLDVGDGVHHEGKDLRKISTVHPMEAKEERLVSLRLQDGRRGRWDDAVSIGKLIHVDDGKKYPVKNTKLGKSVMGQRKGHDLLLTMLNEVSAGISKQKQMVKSRSLQEASKRKTKVPEVLGNYASALLSSKLKDTARLLTTNRAKAGSKEGQKSLAAVEVKDAHDSALLRKSKGENDLNTAAGVKTEGSRRQNNSLQVGKDMEGGPVRRDADRGTTFASKGMEASVENWLSASGGFEFLDRADEDKLELRKPDLSETVRKNSDLQSSSDRTSLHSWSVRNAGVVVPEAFATLVKETSQQEKRKASQDSISPVLMGVQTASLSPGFPYEGTEKVHHCREVTKQELFQGEFLQTDKDTRRNYNSSFCEINLKQQGHAGFDVTKQGLFQGEFLQTDKDTRRNDNSSFCEINLQQQGHAGFDLDPVDSFIHVFQEYKEKSGVRGPMRQEAIEDEKASVVAEKLNCFGFKPQKRTTSCNVGTRSSSDADDKLTESEELELALLELVIKTVLRDDLIKNAKFGPATAKEESSPLAANQRPHSFHVDQAVQALVLSPVHDVQHVFPTPDASASAISSGRDWPDYTCLAEQHSRSESLEEDDDWPEYAGLDDQAGNVEEDPERDLPVAEGYPNIISEPGTFHGPSTMTKPLPESTTSPPSSLPINISETNNREFIQFPGLSSLAFPCAPSPQSKRSDAYVADRSSTGVQTNDLSVGEPINSLYVLPLYCLPHGSALLTPYSMYPQFPVPEGPSCIHPIQIPSVVRGEQSQATTAAISEDVQGTSNIHTSKTNEPHALNPENESKLMSETKSSTCTSSDAPLSSPRTPSTPVSLPEHEARVASALGHHRRRQKRQILRCSSEYIGAANIGKGENEEIQTERKLDYQQLPVSNQESLALARNLHAARGNEEYPHELLTTSTVENQLRGDLPLSVSAASARTRKDHEITPFVYYDDTESSQVADSYDGSGSSEVSVYPRMYSGLDVPLVGMSIKGLEKLDRAPTNPVTETRTQSPGETQQSVLGSARQGDGLRADLVGYSLEEHLMYRKRDLTRWSGIARDPGLPLSEGEIDLGGLRSEGECGPMYSDAGFLHRHLLDGQDGGEVSEPGEVSRVACQQVVSRKNSTEESNLIQSLSEGEIREDIWKQTELGETNTPRGSAEERSCSE